MSGGQPWPEWRKPHLGSTWRGDEWKKSPFCALCVLVWVCRGEKRKGHTNQHLYSDWASVRQLTPQTKEMQSTHAPQQSTQQTLHSKQTRSLTNHLHTSMSGYNARGQEQIGTWFHRTNGNRRVQGITPTYPLSSPWKERKRFCVSFPTEDLRKR